MTKVYRLFIGYYSTSINHVRNTWSGVRSGGISTWRQALSVWPRLSRGSQQGLRLHICYAGYLYFVASIVSEVCWVVTKRRGFLALETDKLHYHYHQSSHSQLYPFRSTLTINLHIILTIFIISNLPSLFRAFLPISFSLQTLLHHHLPSRILYCSRLSL